MEIHATPESQSADAVYRQLQEHLDEFPVPFPPTKTGAEIRLLKYLFTPEEAKIACLLKYSPDKQEPLDSIYERAKSLGYSKTELEQRLDAMVRKGAIASVDEDGQKTYGGAQLVVGMFEYQVNKITPEFNQDFFAYVKDGWAQATMAVGVPQLRVVPVGITVEHKTAIATYDDIKQIMASADGPFIVTNCVCRQYWDVLKKSCKNTDRREVCIGWGRGAKMYTKQGWGKPISREEALAILKENEKQGMILQPSNAQQPDFVCSCCTCCDINLKFLKSMPTPATFIASNYVAQSDPAICTGCGTCVDRCQMAAVTLQDEKAVINKMRCIGCGNCAATCPSEAMSLAKKDYETVPPATVPALYEQMLQTRNKIKEREMKKKARQARRGG